MQQSAFARPREQQRASEIEVASVALVADCAGALFLESERALIVADLHLEKGSAFAERRVFLPPYDTAATLARLASLIGRYRPRLVAALGDSFHDRRAGARMETADRAALATLQVGRDWVWIAGNHDPDVPAGFGETVADLRIAGLLLRHEPSVDAEAGEIAGHLHPVARVVSQSGSVRRRCFMGDGHRCIMPAFGAYAGGLNIRDRAFAPLFPPRGRGRLRAHVLGRDAVYCVDALRCTGD